MKIYPVDLTDDTLVLSAADLYTLCNANVNATLDPSRNFVSAIVPTLADGQTIFQNPFGGTSIPPMVVQPSYYPKAVRGAECAAHVTTLDWANENLLKGYQWLKTARGFFVGGVLNSTQTDANDPFASSDLLTGQVACWKEAYNITFNPFAS